MKVELPYLLQDQLATADPQTGRLHYDKPGEVFLDGPVCRRVAVIDFDEQSGCLVAGARFVPPAQGRKLGRYELPRGADPRDRAFQQVSVFATVLRTMRAFEVEDVLGRDLTWAFPGPQLLVIPRAGDCANAFYERESRSLQFFSFRPESQPDAYVHTSLSHDIVAHETGHAILDGIAPGLYHAIAPQSLALHEAIADLTALVGTGLSSQVRSTVLDETGGTIRGSTAFSTVAVEFGRAQGRRYLRSLQNDKTLDTSDRSRDEHDEPNLVDRGHPHDLSQVLTGALFALLVECHDAEKTRAGAGARSPAQRTELERRAAKKALGVAIDRFRRIVFRALDYLPPGEVSFADFGRAVLAADQAAHPSRRHERTWIRNEFVKRRIVPDAALLDVPLAGELASRLPPLTEAKLAALQDSDWAAYDFVNQQRELLRIPPGIPFLVHPRLDVTKLIGADDARRVRELVLKASWLHEEPSSLCAPFPRRRAVRVGTTLVLDRRSGRLRALLSTDHGSEQCHDRDVLLQRLIDAEMLATGNRHIAPDGRPLRGMIACEIAGDVLRVRGAARTLHVARWDDLREAPP